MASRVAGYQLLRRVSRLLAPGSTPSATPSSGNQPSHSAISIGRRATSSTTPCEDDTASGTAASTVPVSEEPKPEGGDSETSRVSKRHDLAMLFTCKVCDTRSAKTMSRATYDTGVVIVRCPKCRNLHLIADRPGWFGEPGSVEDFLAQQGVPVRTGDEASYEFRVEDLAGWSPAGAASSDNPKD